MTQIPNFADLAFEPVAAAPATSAADPWLTPEGIAVKPAYRSEDVAGLVAFIVSPRGRWLHGAAIDMDGGQVDPLRMSRYD